jgi:hypothetical protein
VNLPELPSDADSGLWNVALAIHRRIESLYPVIASRNARFRGLQKVGAGIPIAPGVSSGVQADRVFCALAIKAATTKRGVATMCAAGDGDSALALGRVLIENAFMMRWLLGGPGRQRLETYVLFMSVLQERGVETIRRVLDQRPHLDTGERFKSDPYHRTVAASVFDDHHDTWAYFPDPRRRGELRRVTIREMFQEVTGEDDPIDYRLLYHGFGSQAVHSGPFSLAHILAVLLRNDCFLLDVIGSADAVALALGVSNGAMLMALEALDEYAGLSLSHELEPIAAAVRDSAGSWPGSANSGAVL